MNLNHFITFLSFIFFLGKNVLSQTIPLNKATLHYTQILFEYHEIKNTSYYKIFISSKDSIFNEETSERSVIDSSTATIISHFKFGKSYYWFVNAYDKNDSLIHKSKTFCFSTLNSIFSDSTAYKVSVLKNTFKNEREIIWLDYMHSAINRKGEVIWFIPNINPDEQCRDLKMAPDGSITYLTSENAININYKGDVLWQISGKQNSEINSISYHHDFTLTKNGNYYLLGNRYEKTKLPFTSDTTQYSIEIGLILEYNSKGDLIWVWDAKNYLSLEEFSYNRKTSHNDDITAHLNALGVDSNETYIYAGFRDISRIIKINKKTKQVVAAYGSVIDSSKKEKLYGQNFFRKQHDANILKNNTIAVLNNNSESKKNNVSSVVIFNQYSKNNPNPKIIWEFRLDFDTLSSGKSFKMGNVTQLKNGNLLICEGAINRIIEVNPNKEILWDAFIEKYSSGEKKFVEFPQYRCSYSSSLYPYYFTTNSFKIIDPANLNFNIVNEGTEPDDYEILILSKDQIIYQKQTSTILPNQLLNLNIPSPISLADLKISVKSSHSKKVSIITP